MLTLLANILTFSVRWPESARRDRDWVEASVAGDPDAFSRLVLQHQHHVFRLAGRFFVQQADVEDVAQETFLTAWSKLSRYKARAPFEHWLTRVCLRCCYAKLRRERHRKDESPLPYDLAMTDSDRDAGIEVERLLQRLTPDDRFVLLMLDGEGWSVAEIVEKIGWSRSNVKVRAHRARKRLRAYLEADVKR